MKPAFIKLHDAHRCKFLFSHRWCQPLLCPKKGHLSSDTAKGLSTSLNYVGVDPFEELLPSNICHSQNFKANDLTLKDIGVIEFHEALAGQVLSNITAMASPKFAQDRLPGGEAVGQLDGHHKHARGFLSLGRSRCHGHASLHTANRLQRKKSNLPSRLLVPTVDLPQQQF